VFPDAAVDAESLLRAADVALYRAKDSAYEGVVVAEPAVADITPTTVGRTTVGRLTSERGPKPRRGQNRRE
jgi:hypothetical protein